MRDRSHGSGLTFAVFGIFLSRFYVQSGGIPFVVRRQPAGKQLDVQLCARTRLLQDLDGVLQSFIQKLIVFLVIGFVGHFYHLTLQYRSKSPYFQ